MLEYYILTVPLNYFNISTGSAVFYIINGCIIYVVFILSSYWSLQMECVC